MTVMVCDLCGDTGRIGAPGGMGLTLTGPASYENRYGGGALPKGTFLCLACIEGGVTVEDFVRGVLHGEVED